MNNKILIILSIVIITVGIIGISSVNQSISPDNSTTLAPAENQKEPENRTILVAKALRDLNNRDILSTEDYKITTLELGANQQDQRDISALSGNLKGFLVKGQILKGEYLLPDLLESPSSRTYLTHSLTSNETAYFYPVNVQESYLLSSLSVGDNVTFYLRFSDNIENNTPRSEMTDSYVALPTNYKHYVLQQIIDSVKILQSQYYSEKEKPLNNSNSSEVIGLLTLKLTQQQLSKLKAIEKIGEIILLPTDSHNGHSAQQITSHEILPQLHSIKELRGKQ